MTYEVFREEVLETISKQGADLVLKDKTIKWLNAVAPYKYSYNFEWLGRPIIQVPQDIVAMQEIIWQVKPDLIIETGIAHGGSLIFSASMLALLDLYDIQNGIDIDLKNPKRKVLGIDIDIRAHNRIAIEKHFMSNRITMIQSSSVEENTVAKVQKFAKDYNKVLVCLDSNHTHEHVIAELNAYAHLVSVGSYCVVFDTLIEDMPDDMFSDRPWDKGNNPKTAVREYLKSHPEFEIDKNIEHKLLITVAPDGYLKRVK